MPHTLKIQIGEDNPILRTVSKNIDTFNQDLIILSQNMLKILEEKNGVGIAAPQVGVNLRIIIAKLDKETPIIMCNPIITKFSKNKTTEEEGCLSLPNIWAPVIRSKAIKMTYQDIYGKDYKLNLNNFAARVIQHEVDHLDAILFTDHVTNKDLRSL